MTGNRLLLIFLAGFGGSAAVEIVMLHQFYQEGHERLPERYRKVGFWIVRTFLAVVGGSLAVAYEIDKLLLAANIGAATPLIIKAFAEGLKPSAAEIRKLDSLDKKRSVRSHRPAPMNAPPL